MTISANSTKPMYRPLLIIEFYLLGTFGLFLLTPAAARIENLPFLSFFVLACAGALASGYYVCVRKEQRRARLRGDGEVEAARIDRRPTELGRWLLRLSALHTTLFAFYTLKTYGSPDGSLSGIIYSLTHPGEIYFNRFQIYAEQEMLQTVSFWGQLLTVTFLLSCLLIPMTVHYWKYLGNVERALMGAAIASTAVASVGTGLQKGLGDLVIISGFILLAKSIKSARWSHAERTKAKRMAIVVMVLLAVIAVLMFGYMQMARVEQMGNSAGVVSEYAQLWDMDSVMDRNVAAKIGSVVGYLTIGYEGLAYNLDTPFEWTYGLGNSFALSSYATQYFGVPDMVKRNNLARTEERTGWPALMYWATLYSWLASDVTFPGVVIVMAFLGWCFAKTFCEYYYNSSILGLTAFSLISIELGYIPANNQLLHNRTSLWAVITLVIIYLIRHFSIHRKQTSQNLQSAKGYTPKYGLDSQSA